MNKKNLVIAGVAIAMALAAWLPTTVSAEEEVKPMKPMKGGEHQMMQQQGADAKPAEGKMMMEQCQAMKEQKAKMLADMKAQDAALTAQVAEMNSAPENKKVELMSAVLTHIVEQQTAMNARKAKMEEAMMQHMMQHMQMGMESMSQCPMMKGMKGMGDKSPDDHAEHHAEEK